jgi:putative intracellular protease/amidase
MQLKSGKGTEDSNLTKAGLRSKWEAENKTRFTWHEKKVSTQSEAKKLQNMGKSMKIVTSDSSNYLIARKDSNGSNYVEKKIAQEQKKGNTNHWNFMNIRNKEGGGRIGVLLFTGFEGLDAFGPLEMFSLLGRIKPINLCTVGYQIGAYTKEEYKGTPCAVQADPVDRGTGAALPKTFGPQIIADYSIDNCPHLDVLIIPGGMGSRDLILGKAKESRLFKWIKEAAEKATLVVTVCTGAALLAETGLLDRVQATTNKKAFDWVVQQRIQVNWMRAPRWVEDGKFVTSGGVSAGTDVALHVVNLMFGKEVAYTCASMAEYDWDSNPDNPMLKTHISSSSSAQQHPGQYRGGGQGDGDDDDDDDDDDDEAEDASSMDMLMDARKAALQEMADLQRKASMDLKRAQSSAT